MAKVTANVNYCIDSFVLYVIFYNLRQRSCFLKSSIFKQTFIQSVLRIKGDNTGKKTLRNQ